MAKTTVYIETSVISYLTARPSRDLIVAAHQQITAEWWATIRPQVECVISPFVIQEAARGDQTAAQKRLAAIAGLTVLDANDEIKALAQQYFTAINIPETARMDALHLATAVWHRADYLLSWNCKHIAAGRVRKIVGDINTQLGVPTPIICTPEELMEV